MRGNKELTRGVSGTNDISLLPFITSLLRKVNAKYIAYGLKTMFWVLLMQPSNLIAQTGGLSSSGTHVYTTPIATADNGYTLDDMVKIDLGNMFSITPDTSIPTNSFDMDYTPLSSTTSSSVKIEVFDSKGGSVTGTATQGRLLFGMKRDSEVSEGSIRPWAVDIKGRIFSYKSTDMKRLVTSADVERVQTFFGSDTPDGDGCDQYENTYTWLFNYLNTKCIKKWNTNRHIIIKATIINATLNSFKIPYMKTKSGSFLDATGVLKILVNDKLVTTVQSQNTVIPNISAQMGDKITFQISGIPSREKPSIIGIPKTWIARFAGDLMYYCSPSVQPGEYNPFIGFDSRIHNLMVRKYPEGFKLKVDDWSYEIEQANYSWSFVADRRMDKEKVNMRFFKDKYRGLFTWPKYHIVAEKEQRRNQKEGVNMQYLNYWTNNWSNPAYNNYLNYDGDVKYMLGYDDDELGYFNTSYDNKSIPLRLKTDRKIAKLENLPWKEMPEGHSVRHDRKGFPNTSEPINEMIIAYRRYKTAKEGIQDRIYNYKGHEIQDRGTDLTHPDGTGSGNNKHPGKNISIALGSDVFRFNLDVDAPLTSDKGFYGSLEGTTWPAYGEKDVPYTLTGLDGRNDLGNFYMEYEWMDRLGKLTKVTKRLADETEAMKKQIKSNGKWTVDFDLDKPAYSSITAYYKHGTNERVMIAGKELKPIFLLMAGVKSLHSPNNTALRKGEAPIVNYDQGFKEGDGHGVRIWQEDYRNKSAGEYTQIHKFGNKVRYAKPYVREYNFRVGDSVVFTAFDGDPHLWDNDETEFYLGARTMAKRTPKGYLDGTDSASGGAYLNFFLDDVKLTNNRVDRRVTHKFDKAGTFVFKVVYRNTSTITHRVKVHDWEGTTRSNIVIRKLNDKEAKWLGVSTLVRESYFVGYVTDVLSNYAYQDGYRAYNGSSVENIPNRWANNNDYAEEYIWAVLNTDKERTKIEREHGGIYLRAYDPLAKSYLNKYEATIFKTWFVWKSFGLHYSSNWLRMGGAGALQTLPPYVKENQVVRINIDGTALNILNSAIENDLFKNRPSTTPWQFIVPLLSYTKYQGFRSRTNPSCVYDLTYLFDNPRGAFSGNPVLPVDPNNVQSPDYSDDFKDQQDFYYALKGRKLMLFNVDNLSKPLLNLGVLSTLSGAKMLAGDELLVFNVKPKKTDKDEFVGTQISGIGLPLEIRNMFNVSNTFGEKSKSGERSRKASGKVGLMKDESITDQLNSSIFPNPSTGIFNISMGIDFGDIVNVIVSDYLGKQVYSKYFGNSRGNKVAINLKNLPKGVYIVTINGKNNRESKKIILK